MRIRIFGRWLTALSLAALVLPAAARAQLPIPNYESPPERNPTIPLPLGHDRMENGGFFTGLEFLYMTQTRHIDDQVIAYRGIFDSTGNLTRALTGVSQPGALLGSGTTALRADDIGRTSWTPGFNVFLGYRFSNGVTLTFDYKHLQEVKYNGGATLVPYQFQSPPTNGTILQPLDTFISSPVFNFNPQFSGPDRKGNIENAALGVDNISNLYGIWNGASEMTILLTQRFDSANLTARIPVFETEYTRWYGLAGGRWAHFWERFKWRTVSYPGPGRTDTEAVFNFLILPNNLGAFPTNNTTGVGTNVTTIPITITNISPGAPLNPVINVGLLPNTVFLGSFIRLLSPPSPDPIAADSAIYTNIVSNNLYGPFCGCGTDCYLGKNFALSCDLTGAVMMNFVKERAKYERGEQNLAPQSKRGRNEYTLAPNAEAAVNLWWYPIEAVQIRVGYNLMTYFNTVASEEPIDFNFSAVDPPYEREAIRVLHGVNVGIAFTF
jgi:hypothetical protein